MAMDIQLEQTLAKKLRGSTDSFAAKARLWNPTFFFHSKAISDRSYFTKIILELHHSRAENTGRGKDKQRHENDNVENLDAWKLLIILDTFALSTAPHT